MMHLYPALWLADELDWAYAILQHGLWILLSWVGVGLWKMDQGILAGAIFIHGLRHFLSDPNGLISLIIARAFGSGPGGQAIKALFGDALRLALAVLAITLAVRGFLSGAIQLVDPRKLIVWALLAFYLFGSSGAPVAAVEGSRLGLAQTAAAFSADIAADLADHGNLTGGNIPAGNLLPMPPHLLTTVTHLYNDPNEYTPTDPVGYWIGAGTAPLTDADINGTSPDAIPAPLKTGYFVWPDGGNKDARDTAIKVAGMGIIHLAGASIGCLFVFESALIWAALAFAVLILVIGLPIALPFSLFTGTEGLLIAVGKVYIGLLVRTWVAAVVEGIFTYLLIYWSRTFNGIGFNGTAAAAILFNLPILWMAVSTISASFDTLTTSVGGGQRGQVERATGAAVRAVSGGVAALESANRPAPARRSSPSGWTEGGSPARPAYEPEKRAPGAPVSGPAVAPGARRFQSGGSHAPTTKLGKAPAQTTPAQRGKAAAPAPTTQLGPTAGQPALSTLPDDAAPHPADPAGGPGRSPASDPGFPVDSPTELAEGRRLAQEFVEQGDEDERATAASAPTEQLGTLPPAVAEGLDGAARWLAEHDVAPLTSQPQIGAATAPESAANATPDAPGRQPAQDALANRAGDPAGAAQQAAATAAMPAATPAQSPRPPARLLPDHAQDYARRGWPVYQLAPGSKIPPKGTRGLTDATTDAAQVAQKWPPGSRNNIGLATGHGFIVMDMDVPGKTHDADHDGRPYVAQHAALFPATVTATTPSGGTHRYYRLPAGAQVGKVSLAPGVDIMGTGGSVLAPGSRTSNGSYAWAPGSSPDETDMAEAPPELLQAIQAASPPPAPPPSALPPPTGGRADRPPAPLLVGRAKEKAQQKGRNEGGFWLAGQLRDNRYSESEAEGVMRDYWSGGVGGDHAYKWSEAQASLKQAYNRAPRAPWNPRRNSSQGHPTNQSRPTNQGRSNGAHLPTNTRKDSKR